MTETLAVVAATYGVVMALAPLLQIRAIRAAGSSRGVSVGYQQVLLGGFLVWLAYGIADGNLALVVPNTVAALITTMTIVVARRYRPSPATVDVKPT